MLKEQYMKRCIELAKLGAGSVAPNPMVGAVLVYNDKIIGEGWHQKYGAVHAEVNCLNSVKEEDENLIAQSTLYVSLEPCAHFGKTPPCTDLIIRYKIPTVVIGCRDPFKEVNGKGIEKLQAAGIEVSLVSDEIKKECIELNKRFFTFHQQQRPFVILKWAQTADGKIAAPSPFGGISGFANKRLKISNEYTDRLVHRWRSEEAAILIGTNTALLDDPELTTRLWPGNSPIRLVVDMKLLLPSTLKIFNGQVKTVIFNAIKQENIVNLLYYKLDDNKNRVHQLMDALYELNIQSVMVEGGARMLHSFIAAGLWDEIRVITNSTLIIGEGLSAPEFNGGILKEKVNLLNDAIDTWIIK